MGKREDEPDDLIMWWVIFGVAMFILWLAFGGAGDGGSPYVPPRFR